MSPCSWSVSEAVHRAAHGVDAPAERVEGSAGAVAWCAANGVDVVRVHDVLPMARVVKVVDAIARGTP